MSIYSIHLDDYTKISKVDSKYKDCLIEFVSKWDELIEYTYSDRRGEIEEIYKYLKGQYNNDELKKALHLKYNTFGELRKIKYYTDHEQYIFIAPASNASLEKGMPYLQLLRQIKAQLYNGIHIPSTGLYDKLKFWDPDKKLRDISSKEQGIQGAYAAKSWEESNEERLKPQPWDGLGRIVSGRVDGQNFLQFVKRNCRWLGGRVDGNQWFSDKDIDQADIVNQNTSNGISGEIYKNSHIENEYPATDASTEQGINHLGINKHNTTTDTDNYVQYGNAKLELQSSNYYGPQTSPDELDKMEQKRRETGTRGEALINDYFNKSVMSGEIKQYTWMRAKNYARSSFDFEIFGNDNITSLIEVKSSNRDFSDDIYFSLAEIKCMANNENYYLYRVYELNETGGMLRIARGMRGFAQSILDSLDQLPPGVHVDSFSVEPKQIESYFDEPMQLLFSNSYIKNS